MNRFCVLVVLAVALSCGSIFAADTPVLPYAPPTTGSGNGTPAIIPAAPTPPPATSNTPTPTNEETVTMLETTTLNDALQILESLSMKYERKKIINMSSVNSTIDIPIHNLTWRKALELILLEKDLSFSENVGVIIVNTKTVTSKSEQDKLAEGTNIYTKQVRISAIAFTVDKAYVKSMGIDWGTVMNGKVAANINFATASTVPSDMLGITASRTVTVGGQQIELNALLKYIETNQLGTIIARPSVTVSSGKDGFIQVGQDVSVKMVDDAGNTTERFFATGVIMDVVPTVLEADSSEVVHLVASVERSSATPGAVSTVINKNKANTDIILYNGEETVIAGLYDKEEVSERGGIPLLKDLPWWVFGIRYLTGYSKVNRTERELVIILKADIIDDAITRFKKRLP